jgi:UDP-2-acetamido-2-deoxy-ribo-hexuluronate aminotransferase
MKVPFFSNTYQEEVYGAEIRQAIDQVIKKGHFILGEEVKKFEKNLADYCKVKHAIGVGNASDALFLAVRSAHLPEGSEVLTTPYTFFASAACLVRNKLKPVFVDINFETYHMDLQRLDEHRTSDTRGIMSVDLFSHSNDSQWLMDYAQAHHLTFLEDSAEAFGMFWKKKHAGSQSLAGVLSFFPTKTLGCFGDGGAVITNNDAVARECRIGRVHGAEKKYHHSFVGINSRLDEIQAAILNVKLNHVDKEIEIRNRIAQRYTEGFEKHERVKTPFIPKDATPVWYVYAPRFQQRDRLASYLAEKGIGTFVYWPKPLHLQDCFADLGYKVGDFPNAEELCDTTLALPIYPGMSDAQVDSVIESIHEFYEKI